MEPPFYPDLSFARSFDTMSEARQSQSSITIPAAASIPLAALQSAHQQVMAGPSTTYSAEVSSTAQANVGTVWSVHDHFRLFKIRSKYPDLTWG